MASLTIGNLDPQIYEQLRNNARSNGRSLEEEARLILRRALDQMDGAHGLGTRINNRFKTSGGIVLDLPHR
ncbi:plasmid stability protein [Pseudomonas sp. GGS8]|uniref:FitA-like ribbon-helix-helix domain-containing protein n=1 Tax=Pseudomonas sp. GGS8 TaxID=2817892 RepID=UPI00209E7AD6|nr:plasmid stabilization protein [Pseudomonas sp. GGS8]MCP1441772.1 plasmid stability protein [Pseudomonas sp. GGS8]